MPITPDTKDWTWVLDRPCSECGFDSGDYSREDVSSNIRENHIEWQSQLARDDVKVRPSAAQWSVLEYACHVRDVYRIFCERITLMRTEDTPVFANWDQDQTALDDDYAAQDPAAVATELAAAAETIAQLLDAVQDDEWERRGTRSNGSQFTIESISIYMLHDSLHHLWDVTSV
jgi:uncharacterized damage-inducible protein DinB